MLLPYLCMGRRPDYTRKIFEFEFGSNEKNKT